MKPLVLFFALACSSLLVGCGGSRPTAIYHDGNTEYAVPREYSNDLRRLDTLDHNQDRSLEAF